MKNNRFNQEQIQICLEGKPNHELNLQEQTLFLKETYIDRFAFKFVAGYKLQIELVSDSQGHTPEAALIYLNNRTVLERETNSDKYKMFERKVNVAELTFGTFLTQQPSGVYFTPSRRKLECFRISFKDWLGFKLRKHDGADVVKFTFRQVEEDESHIDSEEDESHIDFEFDNGELKLSQIRFKGRQNCELAFATPKTFALIQGIKTLSEECDVNMDFKFIPQGVTDLMIGLQTKTVTQSI